MHFTFSNDSYQDYIPSLALSHRLDKKKLNLFTSLYNKKPGFSLFIILISSGDIRLNPGPRQAIVLFHAATVNVLLHGQIKEFAAMTATYSITIHAFALVLKTMTNFKHQMLHGSVVNVTTPT